MTYSQSGVVETTESKSYIRMMDIVDRIMDGGEEGNQDTARKKYALDMPAGNINGYLDR